MTDTSLAADRYAVQSKALELYMSISITAFCVADMVDDAQDACAWGQVLANEDLKPMKCELDQQ